MAIRVPIEAHEAADGDDGSRTSTAQVDFAELWEHRAALRDICQRIVGDAATADDVVQETYIRALNNLDRLERRPSLMPWLATVARRRSIDELRKRKYSAPMEIVPEEESKPELDPGESVAVNDTVVQVREALTALTDRERDLLMRQVNQGLTLAQLADEEDSSVASVRSVLNRARTKLREALADTGSFVLAPLFGMGGWLKRKLGPVQAKMHQVTPVLSSGPYERVGEALTAGVAAAALAIGGVPLIAGGGSASDAVAQAAPAVSAEGLPGSVASAVSPSFGRSAGGGLPVTVPSGQTTGSGTADASPKTDPSGPSLGTTPTPGAPDPSMLPTSGAIEDDGQGERNAPAPRPRNPVEEHAETPDDGYFESLGASEAQSGGKQHVFAVGQAKECDVDSCAVLFASDDGGKTWERRPAEGLRGTQILVAPGYPSDSRIYAMGPDGLQVSFDHGANFQEALGANFSGPAAMAPNFSVGNDFLLLGASPQWRYNAATQVARPAPYAGLPATRTHFAYTPNFASSRKVFASSTAVGADGWARPAVYTCADGSCASPVTLPGFADVAQLHVSSTFADDGLIFAWAGRKLVRSVDGGSTFSTLELPTDGAVTAIADDGAGNVFVSVDRGPGTGGGILRSTDGGTSWDLLGAGTSLAEGARAVHAVPGGRLLAAPADTAGGGLLCSTNQGRTWSARCS